MVPENLVELDLQLKCKKNIALIRSTTLHMGVQKHMDLGSNFGSALKLKMKNKHFVFIIQKMVLIIIIESDIL